jgi:hypothetical protein
MSMPSFLLKPSVSTLCVPNGTHQFNFFHSSFLSSQMNNWLLKRINHQGHFWNPGVVSYPMPRNHSNLTTLFSIVAPISTGLTGCDAHGSQNCSIQASIGQFHWRKFSVIAIAISHTQITSIENRYSNLKCSVSSGEWGKQHSEEFFRRRMHLVKILSR